MGYDHDDIVFYSGCKGRVQESTSDKTHVQFDNGKLGWIRTSELERGE